MKKIQFFFLTSIIFLVIAFTSKAQTVQLRPIFKAEAGIHGLGLGYELPFSKNLVGETNIHAGGGFNVNTTNEVSFHYIELPSIHISTGIKRYYNLHKIRRNPANNAGNFFGAQIKFVSQGLIDRSGDLGLAPVHPPINDVLISEIHWGVQRSISERFFFTAKIGAGYIVDFHNMGSTIFPAGGVKLAYRLN